MDYKEFCRKIAEGETPRVDFKLDFNAFVSQKDNAEFLKDIIALANNGYVSNYLIIGLSDDGKGFKSVTNPKLTDARADDRLQRLARDNIHPVPAVKLIKRKWPSIKGIDKRHQGKTFVMVQVGPQPRQCFRFNKDHVDYMQDYCFRKHEVWIRRGSTSDLAAPEEIKRLLEGKAAIAPAPVENNIDYMRLHKKEIWPALRKDLENVVAASGGRLHDGQVELQADGKRMRLLVFERGSSNYYSVANLFSFPTAELFHGILLICHGSISRTGIEYCPVSIQEPWGWFFGLNRYFRFRNAIPPSKEGSKGDLTLFCIALPNIKGTGKLHHAWSAMLKSLNEKEDIKKIVNEGWKSVNTALRFWLKKGCVIEHNGIPSDGYYPYVGAAKPEEMRKKVRAFLKTSTGKA